VPGTQTGWTVGEGGKILKSTDGGAQGGLLQADGKIVAVRFQATSSSGGVDFALARYLSQ